MNTLPPNSYGESRNRFVLRNGWSNLASKARNNKNLAMGKFRAYNNAGDILSRTNYSCGGSNMVSSSKGSLKFTTKDGGPSSSQCDNSGISPSTCNVKYVYDSSDFIKFKKQVALSKNY